MKNVSSEEELLELRNEGKISGAEYNDLLATMRTSSPDNVQEVAPGIDEARTKRRQGKTAFVLMLTGVVLPSLGYFIAGTAIWFYMAVACEIAAFVLGVISWAEDFGKAAAITALVLAVLVVILFVLMA
ncbi:MAG: hypothetical protein ISS79_12610 [Phycisphaerae bacterium]|nr:hypothetical protein [Phycisphaerae bacterium]